MDLGGEKLKGICYGGEMKMDLGGEGGYMYDNMWGEEEKGFYEVNMDGVEWKGMRGNYGGLLGDMNNKYE